MTILINYRREPRAETRQAVKRFFEGQGFTPDASDENSLIGPDLPYGALNDLGTMLTLSAGVGTTGLQIEEGKAYITIT